VEGTSVQLRLEDLVPSNAGVDKLQGLGRALDQLGTVTSESLRTVRDARMAYEANPTGETESNLFNANAVIIRNQYEALGAVMQSARDASDVLGSIETCIAAMSEPMVSHDCIGFYLLSQAVARHVKVVQSGQGADEVFAGYHWYPPMLHSDEPVGDYARVFFDRDHAGMAEAIDPQLLGDDYSRAFVAEHFAMPGADRPIDKTLRLDTQVMLIDDPVKRVDNMTMAWGLEGRVPFLDHELVELSARIPAEMKVGPIDAKGRGVGKYVLKEAARRVIPSTVIDRPKGYFPVPALKYLRGEYLEMVRDVLNQPAARQRTLFNRDYVDKLLADPEQHITPLRGSKLWQVALLEYWLQVHGV
jgi:asparagine synthase (glutamine-hydrolysing)